MRTKRSASNGSKQRIGAVEWGRNLEPNWLTRRWLGARSSPVMGDGTEERLDETDGVVYFGGPAVGVPVWSLN